MIPAPFCCLLKMGRGILYIDLQGHMCNRYCCWGIINLCLLMKISI